MYPSLSSEVMMWFWAGKPRLRQFCRCEPSVISLLTEYGLFLFLLKGHAPTFILTNIIFQNKLVDHFHFSLKKINHDKKENLVIFSYISLNFFFIHSLNFSLSNVCFLNFDFTSQHSSYIEMLFWFSLSAILGSSGKTEMWKDWRCC